MSASGDLPLKARREHHLCWNKFHYTNGSVFSCASSQGTSFPVLKSLPLHRLDFGTSATALASADLPTKTVHLFTRKDALRRPSKFFLPGTHNEDDDDDNEDDDNTTTTTTTTAAAAGKNKEEKIVFGQRKEIGIVCRANWISCRANALTDNNFKYGRNKFMIHYKLVVVN